MSETKLPNETAGDAIRKIGGDAPKPESQGTAADALKVPKKREIHPSGPRTLRGEPLPTEKEQ